MGRAKECALPRKLATDVRDGFTVLDEAVPAALDTRVSTRMIDQTGSSPLAMIELAAELSAEQLAGRFPLPRRLLHALLARADYVEIPDAPHGLLWTHSEDVNHELLTFLSH